MKNKKIWKVLTNTGCEFERELLLHITFFDNSYFMVKDTERLKGQSLFQKARKQK